MSMKQTWQWCFSTLGCVEKSLEELARLAEEFDIRRLELRGLNDRLDLPGVLREVFETPARLSAALEAHNLTVPVLDSGYRLADADSAARETLLEHIAWAEGIGAGFIRVFDGGRTDAGPATEAQWSDVRDAIRDSLLWWNDLREEHGWQVDLILETHDSALTSTRLLDLRDKLDRPLGILWDTHHTFFYGGEPPRQTYKPLRDMIHHVHIKDRDPSLEGEWGRIVLPGDGEYPLRELLDLLTDEEYTGDVCLEWERKWNPYLPPIEEALKRLREFQRE
jgi:sugar phosphate isomerase/epimerase